MYNMYDKKMAIDSVSLVTALKDFGNLESIGGMSFIMHLIDMTVDNVNTKDYIRIIKDKAYSRRLIEAAEKIIDDTYESKYEVAELLDDAENKILDITRSRAMSDFKKSAEVFDETLAKIQKIYNQGSAITGIKSLFGDLDNLTGGFQRGDLIILAARPSVGKTAFALNADAERYTVGWQLADGTLTMVFPKQYELLLGADKMEMEKGLMEELARAGDVDCEVDTLAVAGLEPAARKGYYIRKGGHYLANEMHSDTYYREIGNGKAVLVFDAALPAESLANLFQEGWCGDDRRVMIQVQHHCYGNRKVEFMLELPQWVAYCKQHKCDVYFGMEQSDGTTLKGTVIVVNPDLGYNHMLYFECAADLFTRLRPHVDAVLYSYVPTHNIKDLFNDYK